MCSNADLALMTCFEQTQEEIVNVIIITGNNFAMLDDNEKLLSDKKKIQQIGIKSKASITLRESRLRFAWTLLIWSSQSFGCNVLNFRTTPFYTSSKCLFERVNSIGSSKSPSSLIFPATLGDTFINSRDNKSVEPLMRW